MGIRIRKMLGYGLTDIKTRNYSFRDGRINRKGILRVDWEDAKRWNLPDYAEWLKAKKEGVDRAWEISWEQKWVEDAIEENQDLDLRDCFVYDHEYGLPKVLCCIPLCERKQWYRYDDMIDYVEANYHHRKPKDYVIEFEENFYPWNGMYWDARDERTLGAEMACAYRRCVNHMKDEGGEFCGDEAEAFAKAMQFESHDDLKKYMRPMVPTCVKLLLEYTEAFTDPTVVRQLRPIEYVYWG